MRKLIVLFSLFICCAIGLYAQPATTDWQMSYETVQISEHCKVVYTYWYRINEKGEREIRLGTRDLISDGTGFDCVELAIKSERMIQDAMIAQLILVENIFAEPAELNLCGVNPKISYNVFNSSCNTQYQQTGVINHERSYPCTSIGACRYRYTFCFEYENNKLEAKYSRVLEESNAKCNENYTDPITGKTYPCLPIDCTPDARGLHVPDKDDFGTVTDQEFFN